METTPTSIPTPDEVAAARRRSRASARRSRQVVEIAALVVAGRTSRASDLAAMHTAEFPDDAGLLAELVGRVTRAAQP